jgi:hypothetical protein
LQIKHLVRFYGMLIVSAVSQFHGAHAAEKWIGGYVGTGGQLIPAVPGIVDVSPAGNSSRVGVCRFTIGDATIPGYFYYFTLPPNVAGAGGKNSSSCTSSLNGYKQVASFNQQYEILEGSGLYWTHVDGLPGGVVAGTEHGGAQTNGICRIPQSGPHSNAGASYVGKDWGGRCFFATGEDNSEHASNGNDYDVLKNDSTVESIIKYSNWGIRAVLKRPAGSVV